MSALNLLCLISYNCRSWNTGRMAVVDLLKSCDICLVQEHWLLHEQLDVNIDFMSVGVSGIWTARDFFLVAYLVAVLSFLEPSLFSYNLFHALTLSLSVSALF